MGTDKVKSEVMLWGGVTGSDVTVPDRKWRELRYRMWRHRKTLDRKWPWPEVTRSMLCACPVFSCAFSYYSSSTKCSTVAQVPWLPEVIYGHLTSLGFLWVRACPTGSWGSRPSGAFWQEMTSSNVSRRAFPGSHMIGCVLVVLSRTYASYYRFLALSLVIYPLHGILLS